LAEVGDFDLADYLLETMSDDEILSQVFMLGWSSQDAEGPIMDWIETRGLGGVKIFGWNANDTIRLTRTIAAMQEAALKNARSIPLLTATDQEGGWVRHIKGDTAKTPGNLAIGAATFQPTPFIRLSTLLANCGPWVST